MFVLIQGRGSETRKDDLGIRVRTGAYARGSLQNKVCHEITRLIFQQNYIFDLNCNNQQFFKSSTYVVLVCINIGGDTFIGQEIRFLY